jgi:hypothetical protein
LGPWPTRVEVLLAHQASSCAWAEKDSRAPGRAVARTMASVRFNLTARRYPRTNKTQADTPTETLAHFACFSSLSRASHRASQHRQSASKRRREPSQRRARPPVGGRAGVERHHSVANRLGFFLGRRKPEPVFFPRVASTTDTWSTAVET